MFVIYSGAGKTAYFLVGIILSVIKKINRIRLLNWSIASATGNHGFSPSDWSVKKDIVSGYLLSTRTHLHSICIGICMCVFLIRTDGSAGQQQPKSFWEGPVLSRGQIILSSALLLLANHNKVTQTLAPCTLPVATGRNRYVLRRQKCDTGVPNDCLHGVRAFWMVWLATSQGTEEGGYDLSPPLPLHHAGARATLQTSQLLAAQPPVCLHR